MMALVTILNPRNHSEFHRKIHLVEAIYSYAKKETQQKKNITFLCIASWVSSAT